MAAYTAKLLLDDAPSTVLPFTVSDVVPPDKVKPPVIVVAPEIFVVAKVVIPVTVISTYDIVPFTVKFSVVMASVTVRVVKLKLSSVSVPFILTF